MSKLDDQRLHVLRQIEAGTLTAEEGAQLLGTLDEERPGSAAAAGAVRVRISDLLSGRQKVSLTIPVGLLGVGLRLGARLGSGSEGTEFLRDVLERLNTGATGRLLDVESSIDGERIEVFTE